MKFLIFIEMVLCLLLFMLPGCRDDNEEKDETKPFPIKTTDGGVPFSELNPLLFLLPTNDNTSGNDYCLYNVFDTIGGKLTIKDTICIKCKNSDFSFDETDSLVRLICPIFTPTNPVRVYRFEKIPKSNDSLIKAFPIIIQQSIDTTGMGSDIFILTLKACTECPRGKAKFISK